MTAHIGKETLAGLPENIGSNAVQDRHGKSADWIRNYPGAKNGAGVWQTIMNQIPPHTLWIEAFGGSAALTRRKRPSASSIVIEADAAVCAAVRGTFADKAGLRVICADAISWLAKHRADFSAQTVIYCDPPYLADTRSGRRKRYGIEMREEWLHGPLLELLNELTKQGVRILVSHYPHPLYDRLLGSWRRIDYTAWTHGGARAECLWCNFPQPTELHDYSALGSTFRERQDLKRKCARWIARLDQMTPVERSAVIGAIDDYRRRSSANLPSSAENNHRRA